MGTGTGHFVEAVERDGVLTPHVDACPKCDGVEFPDVHTDAGVQSDDESPSPPSRFSTGLAPIAAGRYRRPTAVSA